MIKNAKLIFKFDKKKIPCLGWKTEDDKGNTTIFGVAYNLEESVLDLLESNGSITNMFSRTDEQDREFIVKKFKGFLDGLNKDIHYLIKNFYD